MAVGGSRYRRISGGSGSREASGSVNIVGKDTCIIRCSVREEDVDMAMTPLISGSGNAIGGSEVVLGLVGLGLSREMITATADTALMDMTEGGLPGGNDHLDGGSGRVHTQGGERVELGSTAATSTGRLIFLWL